MRLLALALTFAPNVAAAEPPMTAAEFQAHIGMNTFSYLYSSGIRGTADYGPGRTLVWAFEGDACVNGYWFEAGDDICFAFEDGELSACWHFYKLDNGLHGIATRLSTGDQTGVEIFEASHTDQSMDCPGADVGA